MIYQHLSPDREVRVTLCGLPIPEAAGYDDNLDVLYFNCEACMRAHVSLKHSGEIGRIGRWRFEDGQPHGIWITIAAGDDLNWARVWPTERNARLAIEHAAVPEQVVFVEFGQRLNESANAYRERSGIKR